MTPIAQMTRSAILQALRDDGFEVPPAARARELAGRLQAAARAGSLIWGADRIVSESPEHPIDLSRVRQRRL